MPANIWLSASDNDTASVLAHLALDSSLVNAHDENGYTPLHAAASYAHIDLLRLLCTKYGGNINVRDFEGDTPLYVAESVEVAKVLVEELGADWRGRNEEGLTAADYIESEGDFPLVAAYLRSLEEGAEGSSTAVPLNPTSVTPPEEVDVKISEAEDATQALPVLDEELKKRIDELAQREDFAGAEAQEELRRLISQAVKEHVMPDEERSVRRREGE